MSPPHMGVALNEVWRPVVGSRSLPWVQLIR